MNTIPKNAFSIRFVLIAALFLSFLPAGADFSKLDAPALTFPPRYPREAQEQVNAALRHPGCKFLGGENGPFSTSLRYSSDTKDLNAVLDRLAQCPGVTLRVAFVQELPGQGCDWPVAHVTPDNYFQVDVSLKWPLLKLEELIIPPAKGPAVQ